MATQALWARSALGLIDFVAAAALSFLWILFYVLESMRRKRIVIVTPGGTQARSGMARMAGYFTRRLTVESEFHFQVLDTYGPRLNTAAGKVLMPFHFAHAIGRLCLACLLQKVSLAHVNMAAYGSVYRKLAILWVCHRAGVPTLLHMHAGNLDQFCSGLGQSGLDRVRRLVSLASGVIVLGRYWCRFVTDTLGVAPDRVTILYNAVPGPLAIPTNRGGSACNLLFLGLVVHDKGMDDLLSALTQPELATCNWKLTVAGSGEVDRYRAEAERFGIADRVQFTGWVDDLATQSLLERADVLVLPSHYEGLPMAMIEAMAFGLAIVITPVGAIPEVVRDGEDALLVPVGDPRRLAEALERAVQDVALRRNLGNNARTNFVRNFDLEIFHDRLTALYRHYMLAE